MSRLVDVFCATQRHQKTKKQKKRNADKGSHGLRTALGKSSRVMFPANTTPDVQARQKAQVANAYCSVLGTLKSDGSCIGPVLRLYAALYLSNKL